MSYVKCKNKNEYLLDGNRYIKTIEICQCKEKKGDEYTLECRIYHRGLHKYIYAPENGYISRYRDSKLLLTVNAIISVLIPYWLLRRHPPTSSPNKF